MAHKNVDGLKKAILSKAKEGLDKQMQVVKREMQESIRETVYKPYEPKQYQRRRKNGGLEDSKNIVSEVLNQTDNGFDFSIQNVALPSRKDVPQVYLAPLIVLGQERAESGGYALTYYKGSENRPYGQPRDFISDTKRRLKKRDIANGLKRYMR